MRLLVVEDDEGMGSALVEALTIRGHEVRRTRRGTDLLTSHRDYQCVILDLGLPDMDGIQVLRSLRTVSTVPLLVLTGDGEERTVIRALRAGADDYLVKPPRMGELAARLETVTRRATVAQPASSDTVVVCGDVHIDLVARRVEVGGNSVTLTHKEFELVRVLTEQPGYAVSREQLMDRIWGDAFMAVSRSLDVHISALRAKLNRPGMITTIRGYGYRWGPVGKDE